ncbi:hypothetical protein SAMN02745202_01657 [Segatella oulorum]|uniref:Uncharacterized protein n=1 Tax=Segatella oulorum TaxID=28136 RepID=A0A1T4Q0Q7_9BACT|nr:hypothetical protein [Segatella oulorum]SJZ97400.1 hypothetical protein SAMN02745202_01657 [Segatella oulorum]
MRRDHITTLDCVHHEHSSPGHGIGMMRDNTMYRQYHHEETPHKWLGMHVERRGRGYPEGVILSKGQG